MGDLHSAAASIFCSEILGLVTTERKAEDGD